MEAWLDIRGFEGSLIPTYRTGQCVEKKQILKVRSSITYIGFVSKSITCIAFVSKKYWNDVCRVSSIFLWNMVEESSENWHFTRQNDLVNKSRQRLLARILVIPFPVLTWTWNKDSKRESLNVDLWMFQGLCDLGKMGWCENPPKMATYPSNRQIR